MQNSQWTYEQSNGSSNGTVVVLVCLRVLGIIKRKNQRHLLGQNFALIVKAQRSRSEIVKEGLDKRKEKRGGKKVSETMSPYLIPHPETNIKEERKKKTQNKSRVWRVQALRKKKKKERKQFYFKKIWRKSLNQFSYKII